MDEWKLVVKWIRLWKQNTWRYSIGLFWTFLLSQRHVDSIKNVHKQVALFTFTISTTLDPKCTWLGWLKSLLSILVLQIRFLFAFQFVLNALILLLQNHKNTHRDFQLLTCGHPNSVHARRIGFQTSLQHRQVCHRISTNKNRSTGQITFCVLDKQANSVALVEYVSRFGLNELDFRMECVEIWLLLGRSSSRCRFPWFRFGW